jgi:type II secretory pathway component GspD/PulD (secretin)
MKSLIPSLFLGLILIQNGCMTSSVSPKETLYSDALADAEALFQQGKLTDALIACVDIQHSHPNAPGLSRLQAQIMTAINDRRASNQELRREDSITRAMLESSGDALVPDTFGVRRWIQGNDSSHVRAEGPMAELLKKEISLHFDNVNLTDIITYLGQEQQINLIADPTLTTPAVTIHAENITLGELFEYLSRNMNISFHMGTGVIWITAAEEERSATPLFTRIYRLRHGLPTQYLTDSGADDGSLTLLDAIERFVPLPEGSDILFDSNTQILLVKNSEHNLAMVDKLVEAMDISQPQVLIEARFISTDISDLRELGVNWLLQSDVPTSRENGQTRTLLESGAAASFGESLNAGEGFTGTFSGILTDPQFQAVLHALEINSDSRTLSAPKVIAVNNRPAYIRIGRDIAYVSDVDIERESFGTEDNRDELLIRDPQVETLETGYELQATPSVGLNRRDINLRLRPEIVELIRFREFTQQAVSTNQTTNADGSTNTAENELAFGGIEFPELARSLIETEVVVQSGETVVMGGLMRQREQKDVRGIPIISSLPFIGKLFTRTSVTREQENLLIFVTATLISKQGEDLVPVQWNTPPESETRGRVIEANGPQDESISD